MSFNQVCVRRHPPTFSSDLDERVFLCPPRRMLKKAVQQGRSERRAEAYPLGYVEGLNDARTLLADFFSILLDGLGHDHVGQFV